MLNKNDDWRNFNWYHSSEPCCICQSIIKTGIEPRFAYVVCETHSKIAPVEVLQQLKEAKGV